MVLWKRFDGSLHFAVDFLLVVVMLSADPAKLLGAEIFGEQRSGPSDKLFIFRREFARLYVEAQRSGAEAALRARAAYRLITELRGDELWPRRYLFGLAVAVG